MNNFPLKYIALSLLLGAICLCITRTQIMGQETNKVKFRSKPYRVYDVCDEPPLFPGGTDSLYRYIFYNTRHSDVHGCNRVTGRVIVGFVVMPDGKLEDIHILRGVDPFLDKEALRLVKEMPRWQTGKIKGKPIACKYTLPIVFRLQ